MTLRKKIDELNDALEFEARVAKYILENRFNRWYCRHNRCYYRHSENCRVEFRFRHGIDCFADFNILRDIRIAVEEEMDAEETARISKSCQADE